MNIVWIGTVRRELRVVRIPANGPHFGVSCSMYPRLPQLDKMPQCLALHAEGRFSTDIADQLGISVATVGRWLEQNGRVKNRRPKKPKEIPCRPVNERGFAPKEISQEDIKIMTDTYISGTSQNEICRRFGLTSSRFTFLMKEQGVEIRGHFKHSIESTYFDKIDTFYKAYFLGWLAADGCISLTRDSVQGRADAYSRVGKIAISIQQRDGYIIEKLKEELRFSGEIRVVDRGPGRQKQCRLAFGDQHMAQTLYRYGLTPNKSASLIFPDIPTEWIPAFILGYFEGDGCVTLGRYTNRGYTYLRQRFEFIASVPFADRLHAILTEKGIKVYKFPERRKRFPLSYVKGASKEAVIAFYRFLYTDAPFFLNRKRDRFLEIFKELGFTP